MSSFTEGSKNNNYTLLVDKDNGVSNDNCIQGVIYLSIEKYLVSSVASIYWI